MSIDVLEGAYAAALRKLASALGLAYQEVANFCGDIGDGAFGAQRLKEFFKAPEVIGILDQIVTISEQYRSATQGPSASSRDQVRSDIA